MKHSPGYEELKLATDSSPEELYDYFAKFETTPVVQPVA